MDGEEKDRESTKKKERYIEKHKHSGNGMTQGVPAQKEEFLSDREKIPSGTLPMIRETGIRLAHEKPKGAFM